MICHNKDPLKNGQWSRTKHSTLLAKRLLTLVWVAEEKKDLKVVSFTLSGAGYKGNSKNSDDHEIEYFVGQ